MKNILTFFEATVEKYPNKIGFSDDKTEQTFAQTMDTAKRIGTVLSQYGKNRPVAIVIDRNCRCINAMLGALYAGCFYTVMDVHSPSDRIGHILDVLGDCILIADRETVSLAKEVGNGRQILVYEDLIAGEIHEETLSDIRDGLIDMDIAYILFTSGSTGIPKGAVISHRALISYINWVTEAFQFDETTVFGSQTPLYFSMSVTDFYSTIKCGCT